MCLFLVRLIGCLLLCRFVAFLLRLIACRDLRWFVWLIVRVFVCSLVDLFVSWMVCLLVCWSVCISVCWFACFYSFTERTSDRETWHPRDNRMGLYGGEAKGDKIESQA